MGSTVGHSGLAVAQALQAQGFSVLGHSRSPRACPGVETFSGPEGLGEKDVLILRNRGLLTTGVHLPAAFATTWCLQRAYQVQLATDSLRGPNRALRPEVLEAIPHQAQPFRGEPDASGPRRGQLIFDAAMRAAGVRLIDLG